MWNFATTNPGTTLLIVVVLCVAACNIWENAMKAVMNWRLLGGQEDGDGEAHEPFEET